MIIYRIFYTICDNKRLYNLGEYCDLIGINTIQWAYLGWYIHWANILIWSGLHS